MKRVFACFLLTVLFTAVLCSANPSSFLTNALADAADGTVLTKENCEDLASLLKLKSGYDRRAKSFVTDYSGKAVAINGFIYDADFGGLRDIEICSGAYGDSSTQGPHFLFESVHPSDFGFQGSDFPDYIEYGTNVHIVGIVKEYDDSSDSIVLEPVSMKTWNPLLDGLDISKYTTLQNGSRGDEVKALQQRLIDLFYLDDKADGIYGNNTKKAVERFQIEVNMEKTGIADPATQAILFSDDAPERTMSVSCSSIVIGSYATTSWYVDGQEFTLQGNQTKTLKTIWGTFKFYANGNYEQIK